MTGAHEPTASQSATNHVWLRRSCAVLVATVAAYSSYAHQRRFALDGGADPIAAALWPLSVDGLVVLASIGLLTRQPHTTRRARWTLRAAFLLGVLVSVAANIAAAPTLTWHPVTVAGWPPLALLLAVELVIHTRGGPHRSAQPIPQATPEPDPPTPASDRYTAEQLMWLYYQQETTHGRTPTGADLDRAAGTNNYGRSVLARWRRTGRITTSQPPPPAETDLSLPAIEPQRQP